MNPQQISPKPKLSSNKHSSLSHINKVWKTELKEFSLELSWTLVPKSPFSDRPTQDGLQISVDSSTITTERFTHSCFLWSPPLHWESFTKWPKEPSWPIKLSQKSCKRDIKVGLTHWEESHYKKGHTFSSKIHSLITSSTFSDHSQLSTRLIGLRTRPQSSSEFQTRRNGQQFGPVQVSLRI